MKAEKGSTPPTPIDYDARRRRFLEALPEGSIALLPAAPPAVRTRDVEYPYRQDNDLHYLTGFPEPGSLALFEPGAETPFTLFVEPRDPARETWTGERAGVEGARADFGADAAFEIGELGKELEKRIPKCERLVYDLGRDERMNRMVLERLRRAQAAGGRPRGIESAGAILHEMRLRKEPPEVERMRRAAEITAVAHREARDQAAPGTNEFEIEAVLEFAFRRLGAMGPAYGSIVASGANATTLHYVRNDRGMREGDLLLIDAGAEFDHYCADVTRTFPVGGQLSPEQKAVYDVVLDAQQKAAASVAPGVLFDDVHKVALRRLTEGLVDLGVLEGPADEAVEKELYKPFFMHRTSHWLGMDVHDVGRTRDGEASRPLEPGMALTIEPGLYFRLDGPETPYRGIGIRIEDDLLVTPDGHENLTAAIPK